MRLLLMLLCACWSWGALWPATAPARPNILIILADDLGFSDLGCYGGEIRTPTLDALAADGLRFTQCYNCSRCCPSRAALLTGLYPHQAGVGSMTTAKPGRGEGYRGALNEHCLTIAEVLGAAGYRTAAAGKWHVSDHEPPTARGFQDFFGFMVGYAIDSWEPGMMIRLPAGQPDRVYAPGTYFATDAITDHALDFIAGMHPAGAPGAGGAPGAAGATGAAGAPWFLYLAYQAPHFPLQSRPQDMAGYPAIYAQGWDRIRADRLARQKALGLLPGESLLSPRSPIPNRAAAVRDGSMTGDGANPPWESLPADRRADLAQRMAVYAGMVSGMDRGIGRVVAALRASGQLETTLILVLSDNGACAEWDPFGFDLPPPAAPRPGYGINMGTEQTVEQAPPRRCARAHGRARLARILRLGLGQRLQHPVPHVQALRPRRRHLDPVDRPLAGRHRRAAAGRAAGDPADAHHRPDGDLRRSRPGAVSGRGQGEAITPLEGLSLRPLLAARRRARRGRSASCAGSTRATPPSASATRSSCALVAPAPGSSTIWPPTARSCTISPPGIPRRCSAWRRAGWRGRSG